MARISWGMCRSFSQTGLFPTRAWATSYRRKTRAPSKCCYTWRWGRQSGTRPHVYGLGSGWFRTRWGYYGTKRDSGLPDRAEALMSEPVREDAHGGALDEDILGTLARLSSQFFADAAAVDSAGSVPVEHLDALAAAGLYGISLRSPREGLGSATPRRVPRSRNWRPPVLLLRLSGSTSLSSGRCSTPPHPRPCARRGWPPLSEAKSREA